MLLAPDQVYKLDVQMSEAGPSTSHLFHGICKVDGRLVFGGDWPVRVFFGDKLIMQTAATLSGYAMYIQQSQSFYTLKDGDVLDFYISDYFAASSSWSPGSDTILNLVAFTGATSPYLDMTKEQLLPHLINGTVSRDWWALTDIDRTLLAKRIIEWWSFPIDAWCSAKGGAGCATPPSYSGYDIAANCLCGCEMGLRLNLFKSHIGVATNHYYWQRNEPESTAWHCVNPGYSFGLPCAVVMIAKEGYEGHWICALQIAPDPSAFDSWIFFNYQEIIKPGNPAQMPYGATVQLNEGEPFATETQWGWHGTTLIAVFKV